MNNKNRPVSGRSFWRANPKRFYVGRE